jgi:hypothetical protein
MSIISDIFIVSIFQKSSEIVGFRGFFYVKSSNFKCGQSSFLRCLERPVSLIIVAQNLRLPARFDTLLQMGRIGMIDGLKCIPQSGVIKASKKFAKTDMRHIYIAAVPSSVD